MKSVKVKFISLIALALMLVITLCTSLGLIAVNASRQQSVTSSNPFETSGGAEVWSHKIAKTGDDDKDKFYSMYVLTGDTSAVSYKKPLAFSWFYNATEKTSKDGEENKDEEAKALTKAQGYFNMEIGFEADENGKLAFEKYVITFESQQYVQSKDGKSANYIILYPNETKDKLNVLITDDKDAELTQNADSQINIDHIKIAFSKTRGEGSSAEACEGGEYFVTVSSGSKNVEGKFVNIGGNYSKYSNSSTTPVTPVSFTVKYPEENEAEPEANNYARMIMYSFNGQSFLLANTPNEDKGHYVSGSITDDAPPVLCLDKGVSFVGKGNEISFNYTVIDVMTGSSGSLETYYYILNNTQAGDADFNADDYTNEKLFRKVLDSDDQTMVMHKEHYLPKADKATPDYDAKVYDGEDMEIIGAVKVLLKLTDTQSTGGESDYVMLDWYVDEEMLVTVNGKNYIAIAQDNLGAKYTNDPVYGTGDDNSVSFPYATQEGVWTAYDEYKKAVAEASKDLKASTKNYFYLPSAEKLFADNSTKYEDLNFYIYYDNGSRSSETSKSYNSLSIKLNKAGKYIFTIYATDARGNNMYYLDKEGNPKEIETGDIWNIYDQKDKFEGMRHLLPWFEFTVGASEISIEEPKEQQIAYVGSTYTPDSFEIDGVSYDTKYSLYRFDNEKYAKEHNGESMTYAQFMEQKDKFLTDATLRSYLKKIMATSNLTEGTTEYEMYNDYAWNGSSLSFVPQDENTFYLIECVVTNTENSPRPVKSYMGIASAPKVNPIKGEDTWVKDNITSIVLLSIAGASLIGIVLLLVIKPKNKGDLDEE